MRTKRTQIILILTVAMALFGTTVAQAAEDVSSHVSATHAGFARHPGTHVWSTMLTVKNTGSSAINGPIQVVLTKLSENASMTNSNGTYKGSPYITVSTGPLAAGASVQVKLQFANPTNDFINFTPVTEAGDLQ